MHMDVHTQVAELERLRAEEMARRKEIEAALEKARSQFKPLPITEEQLREELEQLKKVSYLFVFCLG
jgi:hypothetical protein